LKRFGEDYTISIKTRDSKNSVNSASSYTSIGDRAIQAVLLTPALSMAEIMFKNPLKFKNALSIFNCSWTALFIIYFVISYRMNLVIVWIFALIIITTVLIALGNFQATAGNNDAQIRLTRVLITSLYWSLRTANKDF
jgi:hypothetical protein